MQIGDPHLGGVGAARTEAVAGDRALDGRARPSAAQALQDRARERHVDPTPPRATGGGVGAGRRPLAADRAQQQAVLAREHGTRRGRELGGDRRRHAIGTCRRDAEVVAPVSVWRGHRCRCRGRRWRPASRRGGAHVARSAAQQHCADRTDAGQQHRPREELGGGVQILLGLRIRERNREVVQHPRQLHRGPAQHRHAQTQQDDVGDEADAREVRAGPHRQRHRHDREVGRREQGRDLGRDLRRQVTSGARDGLAEASFEGHGGDVGHGDSRGHTISRSA